MKVLAYYPLHYGAEYLDASIRSIHPYVDKILILYAERPSFGKHIQAPCPEPEWLLRTIADAASDKIEWMQVAATGEGEHRKIAMQHAGEYDLLLAVDADEIWSGISLQKCLAEAYSGNAHRYNIRGFINFWKSFNYIVTDFFYPARIYNMSNETGETIIDGMVYHFGYAQRNEIIEYKMQIHGHRDDIREGWLTIYHDWTPESRNLHPASTDVWIEALPFDKETLPPILQLHPNFNKEIIL